MVYSDQCSLEALDAVQTADFEDSELRLCQE